MRKTFWPYVILCLLLSSSLAACGPESSPTAPAVPPLALVLTPLPTEYPIEITAGPPPGVTPVCYFSAGYASFPAFPEQLQQAQDIVQVLVEKIGPLVWNTVDGKPATTGCGPEESQYAALELTIKESYKGTLAAGSKLSIQRTGAPGSLVQGNYDYFPKLGESVILFLGATQNVRPATPNDPINTRIVRQLYRQQAPGKDKWISQLTTTPFSLEYLKAALKTLETRG